MIRRKRATRGKIIDTFGCEAVSTRGAMSMKTVNVLFVGLFGLLFVSVVSHAADKPDATASTAAARPATVASPATAGNKAKAAAPEDKKGDTSPKDAKANEVVTFQVVAPEQGMHTSLGGI